MRIVLIAAQSLDGFITKHAQPGTAFTSPEDKAHYRTVLRDFDVGVLGGATYRASREAIKARPPGQPPRIVMTRSPDLHAAESIPGMLEFTNATPVALAKELGARGYGQCALLGGSHIHSLFLAAGLVDEIWLTIEPLLFGSGTPLLAHPADIKLNLNSMERLGADSLLAKYRVVR